MEELLGLFQGPDKIVSSNFQNQRSSKGIETPPTKHQEQPKGQIKKTPNLHACYEKT